MLEFTGMLGKEIITFFSFDAVKGFLLLVIAAVALVVIGYLIKGLGGAIVAVFAGILLFLYLNGLFPF